MESQIVVLPVDQFEALVARAVETGVAKALEQHKPETKEPLLFTHEIKAALKVGERGFQSLKKRKKVQHVDYLPEGKRYRLSQFNT